jgi:hypothetical protein
MFGFEREQQSRCSVREVRLRRVASPQCDEMLLSAINVEVGGLAEAVIVGMPQLSAGKRFGDGAESALHWNQAGFASVAHMVHRLGRHPFKPLSELPDIWPQ